MNTARLLSLALAGLFAASVAACSDDGGEYGGSGYGPSGTGPSASPLPAWAVGSYSTQSTIENNIAVKKSKTIELSADGKSNKNGSKGEWKITGSTLVLNGSSLSVSTAFTKNCRVLVVDGEMYIKSKAAKDCPLGATKTSTSEQALAGTYTKGSSSGSPGGSVSASESTTIRLEEDRLIVRSTSRTDCRSYGTQTKCLTQSSTNLIGTWTLSGSSLSITDAKGASGGSITLADLKKMEFSPADDEADGGTGD